jgi:hypothetical protein
MAQELPKGRCPIVLKPEYCDVLNKVLQEAVDTRELCKACEECGLPTDDAAQMNAQQIDSAARLKAKFFPLNP